ncbi:globin-like protein [Metschnikowia bicuspidata]|uniref:nitric oxide dioxygenase n=1 Tax=Metschnikowia bicuspidata TaxID=27322 RepID=A0A4P9ZEK5_9ASCO|nr:globin-like protein [Metschnikowia bicuspidata]
MIANNDKVKPFFNKSNQVTLKQPKVLAFALLNYAQNIDDLNPLRDFVEQIVVKHVGLQVKADHYPIVGTSLITIKKLLGPEVATEDFIEAWATAYGNSTQTLTNAEFAMYQTQQLQGFREFTVTKLVDKCLNMKSVYFTSKDGRDIGQPLPAQSLDIRFVTDNSQEQKSKEYSISKIPRDKKYRNSVRRADNGVVSSYIHRNLKEGEYPHGFSSGEIYLPRK